MTKYNNVIVFPNARRLPQQHPFCWNVPRIRRFVLLFRAALNINMREEHKWEEGCTNNTEGAKKTPWP